MWYGLFLALHDLCVLCACLSQFLSPFGLLPFPPSLQLPGALQHDFSAFCHPLHLCTKYPGFSQAAEIDL